MKIALFDFDGTLTRHDSLLGFIVFACGPASVARHLFGIVRILFLWKIGIYTAAQGKAHILALFFHGWTREQLSEAGRQFAEELCLRGFRRGALEAVRKAQGNGRRAVIVSASAEEWTAPVAERLGMDCVCTRLAYDAAGRFNGHFEGDNCNGQEKVRRLQERFPDAEWETAEVFGDSEGDIPMFSLATRGTVHYRPFRNPLLLLFELARPRQWVKNFFVFLPAFFSGRLVEPVVLLFSLLCFLAFSLCASSIYMLNDLKDCEEDRNHPTKKYRPLARGALLPSWVIGGSAVCMAGGLAIAACLGGLCAICLVAYLLLNLFYIYYGKQKALLDIVCIALGYDLRVLAALFAIQAAMSHWLVLMVFLLSMFLAIGKRWDDLSRVERAETSGSIRPSLIGYSKHFVISALTFLSAINVVCYILYSMDPEVIVRLDTDWLFLTSFWVIVGNLRYLQLLMVWDKGVSPTKILLRDLGIQLCVLCWVAHLAILIYF